MGALTAAILSHASRTEAATTRKDDSGHREAAWLMLVAATATVMTEMWSNMILKSLPGHPKDRQRVTMAQIWTVDWEID